MLDWKEINKLCDGEVAQLDTSDVQDTARSKQRYKNKKTQKKKPTLDEWKKKVWEEYILR